MNEHDAASDTVNDAPAVNDESLRAALELAFIVAVVGARQRPPIAPPPSLRPFLKLQKLPDRALGVVRRVIDHDATFRERVAAVASRETVDELGLLWLQRPDGWQASVAETAKDLEASEAAETADRAERSARRRLDRAEEVGRRLKTDVARERLSAKALADTLETERARRVAAEGDRDKALARLGELERNIEKLRRRVDDAEMAATASRSRVAELEVEYGRVRASLTSSAAIDRVRLTAAIEQAGRAVAEAASLLGPPTGAEAGEKVSPHRARVRSAGALRRSPLVLPGLFSDSKDAADWLLRQPGVWLLVDGYNVAKLAWADAPLEQQRSQLVDALSEFTARFGTETRVVFDGAGLVSPGVPRSAVSVTYSAAGVTADDAIVEFVAATPIERPIVVATSDADVRRRTVALGANTVSSVQLLGVLGR